MTEPHPMHGFTGNELARFPNLGEAIETTRGSIEGALFWVVGESGIIDLPRDIMKTVDATIDGTDAQKEAVMIGSLYYLAPIDLAEGKGGFASKYGAETGAVLEEMARLDPQSTTVLPEKAAQAVAVMSAAVLKAQREIMDGGPATPSEIVEALKQGMAQTEALMLPNLNAPKLEALYRQEKKATLDVMAGKPAEASVEAPAQKRRPANNLTL